MQMQGAPHHQGNLTLDEYAQRWSESHDGQDCSQFKAWAMAHKGKATSNITYNSEDPPEAYSNATIHCCLSEYTEAARIVYGPDYDPSTEPLDGEIVMRVGGGKKHGRYWIGDSILDTATTPTLSQIRRGAQAIARPYARDQGLHSTRWSNSRLSWKKRLGDRRRWRHGYRTCSSKGSRIGGNLRRGWRQRWRPSGRRCRKCLSGCRVLVRVWVDLRHLSYSLRHQLLQALLLSALVMNRRRDRMLELLVLGGEVGDRRCRCNKFVLVMDLYLETLGF